jgi:hypothetical protein
MFSFWPCLVPFSCGPLNESTSTVGEPVGKSSHQKSDAEVQTARMPSGPHRKFRPRISDLNFEFRENYMPVASRLKLRSRWRALGGRLLGPREYLQVYPGLRRILRLYRSAISSLSLLCVRNSDRTKLTPPLLKLLPFVRTRNIRPRLSRGKSNSTLQSCNVEPSRCHNEDMKARAYRNKSESN